MKKYLVDMVVVNKESQETKNIQEVCNSRIEAEKYRQKVFDNMLNNCYSDYAKIFTIVICHCGEEIACFSFTNTCDKCESDYNFNGDLLASRSQWGYETGECWSECY